MRSHELLYLFFLAVHNLTAFVVVVVVVNMKIQPNAAAFQQ